MSGRKGAHTGILFSPSLHLSMSRILAASHSPLEFDDLIRGTHDLLVNAFKIKLVFHLHKERGREVERERSRERERERARAREVERGREVERESVCVSE